MRVFSSVLSSLLSDRIRFRIGKIASLSTLINLHLPPFSVHERERYKREKQAQMMKSSSLNSTNSREVPPDGKNTSSYIKHREMKIPKKENRIMEDR